MAKRNCATGTSCCICGSQNLTVLLAGRRHSLDGSSFGSSRTNIAVGNLLRCGDCGFGFSEVRPDEDRLGELYRDLDIQTYEAEMAGRAITARRHLQILQRYRTAPGRLLDIGCASGRFLREAFSAGWEVFGVEPSSALFEMAKVALSSQGTIFQTTLQQANFPASFFDAATMWDVLEHVPEPVEFLALAASLLRPGGHLVLNIPNLDSIQARLLGARWPLVLPEHLNYFNKSSLRLAAEKVGLYSVQFGTRPAAFSLRYIAHRLRQHGTLVSKTLESLVAGSFLGERIIPVYLGEICAILLKPQ